MSSLNAASRRYFSLMKDKNFVGGQWVTASSGKTFDVTNPVNDKVIGYCQDSTPQDAQQAIDIAAASFKSWAAVPGKERSILLRNLMQLVNTNAEDLAKLMTAECGKPLAEAKAEVAYSAGMFISLKYLVYSEIYLLSYYRLSRVVC